MIHELSDSAQQEIQGGSGGAVAGRMKLGIGGNNYGRLLSGYSLEERKELIESGIASPTVFPEGGLGPFISGIATTAE